MATSRHPFDPIPQLEIAIIETEVSEQVECEAPIMEFDETDGSVVVMFDSNVGEYLSKQQVKEEGKDFFRNLVTELDEDELLEISTQVGDNYEADKDSRADWESMFERGFALLGLKLQ